jgi:uncharacterized membrane protein YgaE (UPF0421/DUF939 family)
MKLERPSKWDVVFSVSMALACLLTYCSMTWVFPRLVGSNSESVSVTWAVISTVFVFGSSRVHSLTAGKDRLLATGASFILCLSYLMLFPFAAVGLAGLLIVGSLLMIALGQRDQIGLTAITTVVVLVVAADKDHNAWQEPFLRLLDTLIGVTIGLACRWILSSMYSVSQQSGFDGR